MLKKAKYQPSEKEQAFLDSVVNGKYDRQILNGLKKFVAGTAPEDMQGFYSELELQQLSALTGTELDVEKRMPVKMTRHYFERAKNSKPLQTLVKANPRETTELAGAEDPGHQMDYSPVEGLLHKYEIGLAYVATTCSAHCRFCYREELVARKEVARHDGTVAVKGLAQIKDVTDYIIEHNRQVTENGGRHPESGREKLREILMSGGDPMVLSNRNIAQWLSALAESGIEQIRIGSKELAFFPNRFDPTFFDMMDKFHAIWPDVNIRIIVHFNHPDEFLLLDENGDYMDNPGGGLQWVPDTRRAVREITGRDYLNIENQAPIIKDINNDPDILRILQREMKRNGIENHYFFCGRDIVGHKNFNVPIEEAWRCLNESQKGLSGIEAHARLSITHYKGKTEVAAVTNYPLPGVPHTENGFVVFKLLRGAAGAPDRGKVCIVGRNPEAIWFSGYEDRVVYDELGLYHDADELRMKVIGDKIKKAG